MDGDMQGAVAEMDDEQVNISVMSDEQRIALLGNIDRAIDVLKKMSDNGLIVEFRRAEFASLAQRLRESSEFIRDGRARLGNGDQR